MAIFVALFAPACTSLPEYPYPLSAEFMPAEGETLTPEVIAQHMQSIEANYAKWKALRPDHYKYIIAKSCYCLYGPSYGPNEIEVRDDVVVRVTYRGEERDGFHSGQKISDPRATDYSIEQLFERAITALEYAKPNEPNERRRGVPRFLIEYDKLYYFPKKVAFDNPSTADEEWVIVVENMRIIK